MANNLPKRTVKIALHVMITPDAKATVDRHATSRDVSQARAADELLILGALAYHMTTGVITIETFRRTVLMMGIPVFLPDETQPLPEWLAHAMIADHDANANDVGNPNDYDLVGPVCSVCADPIPISDIPLCASCRDNIGNNPMETSGMLYVTPTTDECGTPPMFPLDQAS